MTEIIKIAGAILLALASGIVISGAVFAFIAVIGIVPRFAQKTDTMGYIKLYEEIIIIGGILGTLTMFVNIVIPLGNIVIIVYSIAIGVFFGALAVSLAEVLNVIPILTRRGNIKSGLKYLVLAIALGKMIGSLLYFLIPGFYKN